MTKLNLFTLALTALSLSACGKSAAEKAVESINLNPAPIVVGGETPATPSVAKWNGTGNLKMTGSPDLTCASVRVEIAEDSKGFELQKFTYDCSGMSSEMQAIRLDLRGSELFMGNDKVGKKQDNLVEFELHDSGATLGFNFLTEGANMKFTHTMKANGFEQTLTATLSK